MRYDQYFDENIDCGRKSSPFNTVIHIEVIAGFGITYF